MNPKIEIINTKNFFGVRINGVTHSLGGQLYGLPIEFEFNGENWIYLSEYFNVPGLYKKAE